jgi:hypothetical protein
MVLLQWYYLVVVYCVVHIINIKRIICVLCGTIAAKKFRPPFSVISQKFGVV